MRCHFIGMFTMLLLLGVANSPSWATTANPFLPTAAEIQGLGDATANFSGSQLSSHVISSTATGVSSAVTWEVGSGPPFGGEDFSRVVYQGFNLPTDLSAFDSIGVTFLASDDLFIKPYIQPDDGFSFSENNGPSVPANTPTMVFIEFDSLTEFANPFDPTNVRAWGYQAFGPKPPIGTTATGSIDISTKVPEPSSLMLIGWATLVVYGGLRRRRM